jgi:ketopantoate reductase
LKQNNKKQAEIEMAHILIGSSNICRFYKPETFRDHKPYIMFKSTKFEHFKVKLDNLEIWKKQVVISVIENFLCDVVGSDPQEEDKLNEIIERVIKEFAEVIGTAGKRFVESRFVVVKPIQRPRDKWYDKTLMNVQILHRKCQQAQMRKWDYCRRFICHVTEV